MQGERLADLLLGEHPDQDLAATDGEVVRDLGAALRLQAHVAFPGVHALQVKRG